MNKNRHLAAVEHFSRLLLKDGVKDRIAKLIVFGSVARGQAAPESDVDLLVLATDDIEAVSLACADASLRTGMEMQISVEPLVYCLDQLRHPRSLFIADAIASGKEIYTMPEPELSRAEARGFLNLGVTSPFDLSASGGFDIRNWGPFRSVPPSLGTLFASVSIPHSDTPWVFRVPQSEAAFVDFATRPSVAEGEIENG